jgi:hypothetical protein
MTTHVLNELSHLEQPTLAHGLLRGSFKETTRNPDGTLQKLTIWASEAKLLKVRETTFTRAGNGSIATVTKVQYDATGAVVETLFTSLTRDGMNRISTATVVHS